MLHNKIVSREDWLVERKKLLKEEKALTQARDRLNEKRRELPWVEVPQNYTFTSENGPVSLSELFGNSTQLIVYHFMFDPEWENGCVSCSLWADNFEGIDCHLEARDIAFVSIARAPIEKLTKFKSRLNWSFNFVSSYGNSFSEDFGVSFGDNHKPDDEITYNYRQTTFPINDAPGISVFVKGENGKVYHSYSTYSRGLDMLNGTYHYIDLTPYGRNETPEGGSMSWVRHHDRYEQ
ncbi:DUF899 domain-containing protein [Kiloniella majae]|uniref:DUF899 domain-containing protein n=1 Tax=Kiloniella majae TaxID=1938558 RepID=UPI000A278270|nr:thioredoxin family protein [Kiloniella majae]